MIKLYRIIKCNEMYTELLYSKDCAGLLGPNALSSLSLQLSAWINIILPYLPKFRSESQTI